MKCKKKNCEKIEDLGRRKIGKRRELDVAYKMQRISVYQASALPIEIQRVCVTFF
jgi:hypothetical protein